MEEEIVYSPEFEKGFNHAYLLAMYEPTLLADITPDVNPSSEYFAGFFNGKLQWQQDMARNQELELEQIRKSAREYENDLERGLF